jgi:hypothetical protein
MVINLSFFVNSYIHILHEAVYVCNKNPSMTTLLSDLESPATPMAQAIGLSKNRDDSSSSAVIDRDRVFTHLCVLTLFINRCLYPVDNFLKNN